MTLHRNLVLAARWAVAVVFAAAALQKIAYPEEFALAVFRYRLLPAAWINPAAILLPWLELAAAWSLAVVPGLRRGAALLMLLMLAAFSAAAGYAWMRGLDIACGCFSEADGSDRVGALLLLRNLALAVLAAANLGTEKAAHATTST